MCKRKSVPIIGQERDRDREMDENENEERPVKEKEGLYIWRLPHS